MSIATDQGQMDVTFSFTGEIKQQPLTRPLSHNPGTPLKRDVQAQNCCTAVFDKHRQKPNLLRSLSKQTLFSLVRNGDTMLKNNTDESMEFIKKHFQIDNEDGECRSDCKSRQMSSVPVKSNDLLQCLLSQKHFKVKPAVIDIYNVTDNTELEHPESVKGIPWSRFREEKYRLHSFFKYPLAAAKSAMLLAEDGFVYTGKGVDKDDTVTCYFCSVQKNGWQTIDIVSDIHREMSPNCPIVTKINSQNIPFTSGENNNRYLYGLIKILKSESGSGNNGTTVKLNSEDGLDQDGDVSRFLNDCTYYAVGAQQRNLGDNNQTSGFVAPLASIPLYKAETTECAHTRTMQFDTSIIQTLQNISSSQLVSQTTEQNIIKQSSTPTPSYQYRNFNACTHDETVNRITAPGSASTAPVQSNISFPSDVSKINNLAKLSPPHNYSVNYPVSNPVSYPVSYPVNVFTKNFGNIQTNASLNISSSEAIPKSSPPSATPDERNDVSNVSTSTTQTTSKDRKKNKAPTYAELGIITERPKRQEYAVKENRLKTFEKWPEHHQLKPGDLSEAGFYFAGYGDCARCFYCGGGLRNWEDEDDVWVEHARWFPKCAFIRQQMGQVFVDTVQELNKTLDVIPFSLVLEHCKTSGASTLLALKTEPLKRDPAVLTVVEFGYFLNDVLEVAKVIKGKDVILSSDILLKKLEELKKTRNYRTKEQTVTEEHTTSTSKQEEDAIRQMKEKNNQLRQQTVCKICMDKEVAVVFLPCGHLVSCAECASAMKDCPVCRVTVKGVVRAFI